MKSRHKFIVPSNLAKAQMEICESLYQDKEGRQKINDYADKVKMPYTQCKGCDSETPTIVEVKFDTCAVCGGQKEKQEIYLTSDWLQTDGSDSTLQYGRLVNSTSWQYMEWTDKPWEDEVKDAEFKLANLQDDNWRKATINLEEYTKEEIADAISTFGYNILHADDWNSKDFTIFQIEQASELFGVKDSIQLACECIFELEM